MTEIGWFQDHASRFQGELKFDEPLSRHTYFRIGGPARILAIPRSVDDLRWLAEGIREASLPWFLLGLGSNVLVADQGFPGLVVKLGRMDLEITPLPTQDATVRVRTGASVAISTLLRRAAQEGWGGLELLTGIPGSVGGAVTMNAGTHLGETKDRVVAVEVFQLSSGTVRRFEGAELRFEYRKNLFVPEDAVVIAAEWSLARSEPAVVKAAIDTTLARRKATQPIDYPSCGSVFKNPHGYSAWQVVDQVGLRGHRVGDAQIAEKHSNFIINLGHAKASDVRSLIELAKSRALDQLGIRLEEEVRYVGFPRS